MTCPKLLDSFGGGVGRVVWQVEGHLSAMRCLLLGLSTKMVQGLMSTVGLGVVGRLLEEVG